MKRITAKILLGSVLMMFVACSDKNNTKEEEKKHWNYEGETGPEHWSEIDQNDCGGSAQSPIDIINTETDKTLLPIDFHYNEKTKIHDIINNGHSIQVDFEPDDYIMINGDKYELKQFHFHEPAEHTIRGVRYPLVIHMVHMNKDGKYAVVAIMAQEDQEINEAFEFLDKFLPLKVNESIKVNEDFNINKVLPENQTYYTYTGSLTTPPCTEGVQWYILKNPVGVSSKIIEDLRKIMPINNFRNVQPLNGRIIKESI
ncbi:carbonic anhydrase [Flavobacterium sp. 90]|uniref:carbonic anhydrase n=2 Tax=unclassified Flavobacterium TaxID=196869 RepID=UPI00104C551A|nr:carbonic anhydrase family protein [Flavobacterium sp. 90]TCK57532.1 carbonic anhydrase [Flavobacterium sp. 90]